MREMGERHEASVEARKCAMDADNWSGHYFDCMFSDFFLFDLCSGGKIDDADA
jgi:hypothetical protein